MIYSITAALSEWMILRRITPSVAKIMKVNKNTLYAQLSPAHPHAKFPAEDLPRLCDAIREAGYGDELDGILHPFISQLRGDESEREATPDLMQQILRLYSSVGGVTDVLQKLPVTTDEKELKLLINQIRTDILPVVLQMQAAAVDRLERLRKQNKPLRNELTDPGIEPAK